MTFSRVIVWIIVACGMLGVLVLPVAVPDGSVWILAIIGACVAYVGFRDVPVYFGVPALVCMELFYGLDVGVISVSFIISIVAMRFLLRFISVTPWSQKDGWSLIDAGVSICFAWFLIALTQTLAVLVGDILYGYGLLSLRLQTLPHALSAVPPLVLIMLTHLVVRRMSVPFKRAILFGS